MSNPDSGRSSSSTSSLPRLKFPVHLKRRKKYRLRRRSYTYQPEIGMGAGDSGDSVRLEQLEQELAQARAALQESEERVVRGRSDMENLRRRFQREKDELRKFATEDLMRSIVPAMDHFGLALQSINAAADIDSVRQGINMIHRELQSVLEQSGLTIIQPDVVAFDPNVHEAVGTEENPSIPDGHVSSLMRPGWALNGRVLRPALVKVNKTGGMEGGNTPPPEQ